MNRERWNLANELFHAALDIPAGPEREKWLCEVCPDDSEMRAEVLSLIESDERAGEGYLQKELKPAMSAVLRQREATAEQEQQPLRAGPYRIVREIGRGGMGAVYLGERDDDEYQTQVAIKLVRRGMDTGRILGRFYRERQTLARLRHPNIARLLDGGTTAEGHPYIVMEFIDGVRITDYCAGHGMSLAGRLRLFLDVCKAVDYAHGQLVVHRDLKPGNILVDRDGVPKLLDFGICKLLQPDVSHAEDETRETGMPLLTPEYASPEQIRGEPVTVVSDVYSLAAVLYELLTGVRPHKIEEYTVRGMERAICETAIPLPSDACRDKSVSRALTGDLDNILMRALDKDPARRYGSVAQFAEDIQRYLAHRPVVARPDSLAYRAGKFLRRRRGLVAAVAAVVASLAAGVFFSMRAARQANENLRMVRQLSNTFVFDVYGAVQDLPGSTKARQLIVRTGLTYLENLAKSAAGGDAELQYEIGAAYRRIGEVQGDVMNSNLGNPKEALASYEKSLGFLQAAAARNPRHRKALQERVTVLRRLGNLYSYGKDGAKTLGTLRLAEEASSQLLAINPSDDGVALGLAQVRIAIGNALRRTSQWKLAREEYDRALQMLSGIEQRNPEDVETLGSIATAISARGACDMRLGRLQDALAAYREAEKRRAKLLEADPSNVPQQREAMFVYSHQGDVLGNPNLANLGDTKGALEAYTRMMEIARRLYQADPSDQRARSDYGIALARMAMTVPETKPSEKVQLLRQAIAVQEDVAKVNPADVSNRLDLAVNHLFVGQTLRSAGDQRQALEAFRAGLKWIEPQLAAVSTAGTNSTLAVAALRLHQGIGELAVVVPGGGGRNVSLEMIARIEELSNPAGPVAKGLEADTRHFLEARGVGATGYLYRAVSASGGATAKADAAEARTRFAKAIEMLRAMEKRPSFSVQHRKALTELQQALDGAR